MKSALIDAVFVVLLIVFCACLAYLMVGCEERPYMAEEDAVRESSRLVGTTTTCYPKSYAGCKHRSDDWTCVGTSARTPTVTCSADRCKMMYTDTELDGSAR